MLELADIKPTINEGVGYKPFELIKKSVDGNTYAIVRENKNYYIKVTTTNEKINESDFDYLGGVANKNKKSFTSFEKATRHLNLMFEEINNHYNVENVNILESESLNEKKFVLKMKKKTSPNPIEEPKEEPSFEDEETEEESFDFDEESEGEDNFDFEGDESEEGEEESFDFDEEGDESSEGEEESFGFDDEDDEDSVEEFGDEELELDDEDEIKDIQSTTGKLGQQLRDVEDISSDLQKWVAKSVLAALDLDDMDSQDKKDIIRTIKKSETEETDTEETDTEEESFDFEEETVEEGYDSYMDGEEFSKKEFSDWYREMEMAGMTGELNKYEDYDSYMDEEVVVQGNQGEEEASEEGNYSPNRAAYESEGKEYQDEDNPNIGGDEDMEDGELLLDIEETIDDYPADIPNAEAEALYGPNPYNKSYDRSQPTRAAKQADKDISRHYSKPAAPGYDLDPVEKWRGHKLPYDMEFLDEKDFANIEDELGLPPCENCDDSDYMSENENITEDHLNDKMDTYEQEKAYEDVETFVRRYGMDVEMRSKETSEDPEETLIYLDIVDGNKKVLVSRINSVGDIEVGEMRGNKFIGEPIDSVEDFVEIFGEDLTKKEKQEIDMEMLEDVEMSPAPQKEPDTRPSEPDTKPGTPDKTPGKDRPSRRPFTPPPSITPGEEPGPKAEKDNEDVEFEY
tara:strand:+ start:15961 stop:18015 length:2055 start_codon:yes stop_codon:yes gene_type:complete